MTWVMWGLLVPWWVFWIQRHRIARLRTRLIVGCIMGGLLAGYVWCERSAWFWNKRQLGVVKEIVPLRIGPDAVYGSCAMLSRGELVTIKKIQDEWVFVKTDGAMGWLPASMVEFAV